MDNNQAILGNSSEDQELYAFLSGTSGEAGADMNAAQMLDELLKEAEEPGAEYQNESAPEELNTEAFEMEVTPMPVMPEKVRIKASMSSGIGNELECIIPQNMVIKGNISLSSDIKIYGTIEGDIDCIGGVFLMGGQIKGNVRCGSLTTEAGGMTGDAEVCGDAILEGATQLTGNISASNIRTNAESGGDIRATGFAEIGEQAVIRGNISCARLSVAAGARIKGVVDITEPEEPEPTCTEEA